jgi:hypothetical protein
LLAVADERGADDQAFAGLQFNLQAHGPLPFWARSRCDRIKSIKAQGRDRSHALSK